MATMNLNADDYSGSVSFDFGNGPLLEVEPFWDEKAEEKKLRVTFKEKHSGKIIAECVWDGWVKPELKML